MSGRKRVLAPWLASDTGERAIGITRHTIANEPGARIISGKRF